MIPPDNLKHLLVSLLLRKSVSADKCCQYVRLHGTNQLSHPLSALFERVNNQYQRVNQYGELDPTRVYATHEVLENQNNNGVGWAFSWDGNAQNTAFAWLFDADQSDCLESVANNQQPKCGDGKNPFHPCSSTLRADRECATIERRSLCTDPQQCTRQGDTGGLCVDLYDTEPPSFKCSCSSGWEFKWNSCNDIDECLTGTHNCHAENCQNERGSFYCRAEHVQHYNVQYQDHQGTTHNGEWQFQAWATTTGNGHDHHGNFNIVDNSSGKDVEFVKQYENGREETVSWKEQVHLDQNGFSGQQHVQANDGHTWNGSITLSLNQNGQSGESGQSNQTDQSGQGSQSGQTSQPGQPGQPDQPGQPGQSENQSGQASQQTQSGQDDQSGQTSLHGQGDQAGQSNQAGQSGQPGQSSQPEQTGQPGQGNQPGQPGKPGQPSHSDSSTTCVQKSAYIQSIVCGFPTADACHEQYANKVYLPEVSGHGVDLFGPFVMDPFGATTISENMATVTFIKQYASGWELEIHETFPYPLTDNFESMIIYKASNNRPDNVAERGSMTMKSVRQCSAAGFQGWIPMTYHGVVQYDGANFDVEFEQFVAMPRVNGHGRDPRGQFSLSSNVNSVIQGNTVTVVYTKTYKNGSFKGRSFKQKEILAWPLTSIISVGYGKATEKSNSLQVSHSMRPINRSGLILSPTTRTIQFMMDGTQYSFNEENFIRFPSIQASGNHFQLGKYTVTGQCNVDGVSTQVFKFESGKRCNFDFISDTGLGSEMTGEVSYKCSDSKGTSDFVVSTGAMANLHQFGFQSETYMTFTRETMKYKMFISKLSFYPIITGSGHDDFNGPFTIEANSIMFPNAENVIFLNYENGFRTEMIMYIVVSSEGAISLHGQYIDSNRRTGWFTSEGGFGNDFKLSVSKEPTTTVSAVLPCTAECASEGDGNARCVKINKGGERTTCECSPGYVNHRDTVCKDVNECTNGHQCQYNNCINAPGSYYCVAETETTYNGFYVINGVRHRIQFAQFVAFPNMSGYGEDETGQFTISGKVSAISGTIKLTKTYTNGHSSEMVIFSRIGSTITGKFSEGSLSGSIMMELVGTFNRAMFQSQRQFSCLFNSQFYGNVESYQMSWTGLTIFEEPAGYGTDSFGEFTVKSLKKSSFTQNQISMSYIKRYAGWSVEINEVLTMGNLISVTSSYQVVPGSSSITKNWTGSQMVGSTVYQMYEGTGYHQVARSTAGQFVFDNKNDNFEVILESLTNHPTLSGNGISIHGSFRLTKSKMIFDAFTCQLQSELVRNGAVNVYKVVFNCPELNLTSNNGHLIVSSSYQSSEGALESVTTSVWFKTTETYLSWHNGKRRIIRASGSMVLFPFISGSGEDEFGQFEFVSVSVTNLYKKTRFWKVYLSGEVVQCEVNLSPSGAGAFSASGFYTSSNKEGLDKMGSLSIQATMGIDSSASQLSALTEEQMLICTFDTGAVDNVQMASLPFVSGSGFDSYGAYEIIMGSSAMADSMINISFTKSYPSGLKILMTGSLPFPMTSSFMVSWSYEIIDGKQKQIKDAMKYLGFANTSGQVSIYITTPSQRDYIRPGQMVTFEGVRGAYTVTLLPYFAGSGSDKYGNFNILKLNESNQNGNKLQVWGTKVYTSGKRKGMKFKLTGTLNWPAVSMSGDWRIDDMRTGKSFYQTNSFTTQTLGAAWMTSNSNFMKIYLGNEKHLNLHSTMIKLPQVEGTGTCEWGSYTIGGSFDGASGIANYVLTFEWGVCHLTVTPTSGIGVEMMGMAIINCSGADAGHNVSAAAWSESGGKHAQSDKFVTGEKQTTLQFSRNDGKHFAQNGVMQYFPLFSGHGTDNFHGKYTVQSNQNTLMNGMNYCTITYQDGFVINLVFTILFQQHGAFSMSGTFTDSPGSHSGTFTAQGSINSDTVEGFCPTEGMTRPESWLWSWPRVQSCPYPSNCDARLSICDAWKKTKKRAGANGLTRNQHHYGFTMKVDIPQHYWGAAGWTVALRFPRGQKRGVFNVWNAQVLNVYQTSTETIFVFTQRWTMGVDLVDQHSFSVTADYLSTRDRPSILFWPERNRSAKCYQGNSINGRSIDHGNDSDLVKAIERSSSVNTADDISTIKIKHDRVVNVSN